MAVNHHLDNDQWLTLTEDTAVATAGVLDEPYRVAERAGQTPSDRRAAKIVAQLLDDDPAPWDVRRIGEVGLDVLRAATGPPREDLRERLLERGFHPAVDVTLSEPSQSDPGDARQFSGRAPASGPPVNAAKGTSQPTRYGLGETGARRGHRNSSATGPPPPERLAPDLRAVAKIQDALLLKVMPRIDDFEPGQGTGGQPCQRRATASPRTRSSARLHSGRLRWRL
jgi:hypothetical protein